MGQQRELGQAREGVWGAWGEESKEGREVKNCSKGTRTNLLANDTDQTICCSKGFQQGFRGPRNRFQCIGYRNWQRCSISPNADTTEKVTKCILVVAIAMLRRLYGTIGDSLSSSRSFQPSRSIAVSRISHFFHLARSIEAMTSLNRYLHQDPSCIILTGQLHSRAGKRDLTAQLT